MFVTGSGLGKLMSTRFVEMGCDVVLWDINEDSIKDMAKEFSSRCNCKAYKVDLSSREQIYQVPS